MLYGDCYHFRWIRRRKAPPQRRKRKSSKRWAFYWILKPFDCCETIEWLMEVRNSFFYQRTNWKIIEEENGWKVQSSKFFMSHNITLKRIQFYLTHSPSATVKLFPRKALFQTHRPPFMNETSFRAIPLS